MHVVALPAHATEMPPQALEQYPIWERNAKLKLDQIARQPDPCMVRSETLTRSGFPAAETTTPARDFSVDLIAIATHGRSRYALEHLFLRSVLVSSVE